MERTVSAVKLIKDNFLVVTDWNWLPDNIEESWVHRYSNNYLIYDRKHRWPESERVIRQKNCGQNIYDMFDFIVSRYENLPETIIFCKGSVFCQKDTGRPRIGANGEVLPNGHCTEEFFIKVCNNKAFTELNDYGTEPWRFNGKSCKIGPENSFLEYNNSWYMNSYPRKYYLNINDFFNQFYAFPPRLEWIRFSPGGCYIIPSSHIKKYNKKFYEKIREIVSWGPIIAEAHMIERAIYTIFNNNWTIKKEYASNP